jgi:hypothetical protein
MSVASDPQPGGPGLFLSDSIAQLQPLAVFLFVACYEL